MTLFNPSTINKEAMAIYTAGFFDGEGCCGLYALKGNYYKPVITISNTNRFVLYSIQRSLELGDIYDKSVQKANWKSAYQLLIRRNQMVKFCELILPYSIVKRRQLELMLQYFDTNEDQLMQREEIRLEMTELNKRGC